MYNNDNFVKGVFSSKLIQLIQYNIAFHYQFRHKLPHTAPYKRSSSCRNYTSITLKICHKQCNLMFIYCLKVIMVEVSNWSVTSTFNTINFDIKAVTLKVFTLLKHMTLNTPSPHVPCLLHLYSLGQWKKIASAGTMYPLLKIQLTIWFEKHDHLWYFMYIWELFLICFSIYRQ